MMNRRLASARILLVMAAAIAVGAVGGCKTATVTPPTPSTPAPVAVAPSNPAPTPVANPTMPMAESIVFKTGSSHQTLTAPANTPLEIKFDPSTMGCSANIAFTSGTFTKTSAEKENVAYSTDGLAAGIYKWKCSMTDCCYGTLIVTDSMSDVKSVVFKTEENHEKLTAPANTPLKITFNPSKMGCSSKIAFTSGSFTKTSAAKENVCYCTDGLPAGTYKWKCSMEKCCYGELTVQ